MIAVHLGPQGRAPALAVLALLASLMSLATGCGLPEGDYFGRVDPSPDPTHFRWCNAGEPEFIDPALVTDTVGVPLAYALFDGLTEHDIHGLPEPSLATHWEVSPDQRRFTFHLHDRGRWSNGRPITAHDFAYHLERVLNPLSFSRNAEPLWKLKNGQLYTEGRVKMVRGAAGPFAAGDVVEVLGLARPGPGGRMQAPAAEDAAAELPSSNLRTSDEPLRLRDLGAPEGEAYAVVPPGRAVTLVDLGGDGEAWAYVHWAEGDGVYGWVHTAQLTGQPNGEQVYWVRQVARPHRVGVELPGGSIAAELAVAQPEGAVMGKDLLTLPAVLGIRVPDPYTLVLETWGPVPYLVDMTPQKAFRATPREAVSRWPLRWTRPEHIVTSGGLHLLRWHERDRIELVKSQTYWNRDIVKIERFTAYSINDQAAAVNYYMHGGCDATSPNNVPSSYLRVLGGEKRGRPYLDFVTGPYLGTYFYLINTEVVSNVHLRRALSHAIDRTPLPKILHGGQIPTVQYMPGTPISELDEDDLRLCGVSRDTPGVAMIVESGKICYVPPPGLAFDVDRARAELALAREQLGDRFPRVLSLKFNTGVEGHKLVAEYIQHEWQEKLGLRVELSSQEWKTYLKATVSGEYEIGRFGNIGQFPDPESEFLAIFRCNAPNNRTRFCNPEFERLFHEAEATTDRKERLALMRQADEVLTAEAAVIPLYVYTQPMLRKPYVRDLVLNLSNNQPMHRAWIDPAWRAAQGGP